MQWQSRSYNPGSVFRPKPHLLDRPESSLFIITTSWSADDEAAKAANLIATAWEQASMSDATQFKSQAAVSNDVTERLRQSVLAVSEQMFKQNNAQQFRTLIETLVLQRQGPLLFWAQVGQPNLFLLRQGRVAALATQPDHSVSHTGFAPLPMVGLGLEPQTQVQTGFARLEPGDQLMLLAQSWLPSWPRWTSNPEFRQLTSALIDDQPDLAFWCGVTDIAA